MAQVETEPAKREVSGFVFSKKTAEGFTKMRRRGVVLPPYTIIDQTTKTVRMVYSSLMAEMLKFVINELVGTSIQDAEPQTPKQFIAKLRGWLRALDPTKSNYNVLKKKFSDQLGAAQKHFFEDFFEDASQPIALRVAFALDKDKVFQSRVAGLNREYTDEAIKRIRGETDVLKKLFLEKFSGWITGDREDMHDITDLVDEMRQTSVKQSKFFARDQYLRFNKALTVASYETAEVEKVRWLTANDGRVRLSHRKLQGKVFPLDKLPEERHDYNCRCGFIPVFED